MSWLDSPALAFIGLAFGVPVDILFIRWGGAFRWLGIVGLVVWTLALYRNWLIFHTGFDAREGSK